MNGEGGLPAASATHDPAATIAAATDADLRVDVLLYLVENPEASAKQAARDLRRREGDVLRLVEAFRASGVVPRPPGRSRSTGTGAHRETRCPSCGVVLELRSR